MNSTQAPRIEFYITKRYFKDRPAFNWSKNQWHGIIGQGRGSILIDVNATPMSGITSDATILACVVEKNASTDARISIYRNDAADGSTPVNKDSYKVWAGEAFKNIPNLSELAIACGTCADSNMYRFFDQNVVIEKEKSVANHWLAELPGSVQLLIK